VATCSFVRANGNQCRANVAAEGDLCLFHDQARLRQAQEARSKGAASTNARKAIVRVVDPSDTPGPLDTVEDASRWASWITVAVATGLVDSRTAHEMSFSLRLFVDARRTADKTDERVKQLEAKVRELRETTSRR
jgi:hypothetical protein